MSDGFLEILAILLIPILFVIVPLLAFSSFWEALK